MDLTFYCQNTKRPQKLLPRTLSYNIAFFPHPCHYPFSFSRKGLATMALTQERMLALLAAAKRFVQSHGDLKKQINLLLAGLPISPTEKELLETVQSIQFLTSQPYANPEDMALISKEETHFKMAYRRNLRSANYMRAKRGQAPKPPGTAHEPKTIPDLGISSLAEIKFRANALKLAHNMTPDYSDPTDDSQPLTPDDALANGMAPPDDGPF